MRKSFKYLLCAFILFGLQNDAFALKPLKTYTAVPDTLGLPFEKNTITTADGVRLKSWTFLPAKDADNKTTLVMAYADAGNMSWWLSYATIIAQVGYTVVLFDYRGFGESDDFVINKDMLYYNEFVTDLVAAIQFAKAKYKGNRTGVWCFSMGTIIATLAAEQAKPDFIIGDSYVTSPEAIKEHYAPLKKQIDLPADAGTYTSILKKMTVPMLIFSGTEDVVTTQESVNELKKEKPAIKIISYKGPHMAGFNVLTDPSKYPGSGYAEAMGKFLKIE